MNYRDLQNISNLSQEILIEGANEEHNVLNRWPYTSPYLQENDSQVCENHQLDEKSVSWDTGRNASGVSPRDAAARRQAQLQSSSNPADKVRASQISSIRGNMRSAIQATGSNKLQSAGPVASERFKNAAIRQRGGSPNSVPVRTVPGLKDANKPAQTRSGSRLGGGSSAQDVTDDPNSKPIAARSRDYKVGGSQGYGISGIKLADSYDLYDIILSHLLDEGYAETLEQAQVIMTNMSEEWRQSIVEAPGEWFGGIRDKARASRASQMQSLQPTPKPLPTTSSPFQKPGRSPGNVENRASSGDSGKLTTYGAGGGKAAEASGKSYDNVMRQGAANLENKNRVQPKNQGPDFGR